MPKLLQYQSKFEPLLPIIPPTATALFSQQESVLYYPRTTQYQMMAFVPLIAPVQQIWVDKWLTQIYAPIPRPSNRAQYTTTELVLPPSLRPEAVSLDKWHQNTNQPRFDSKRQQYSYDSSFFTPLQPTEQITLDKWYQNNQQPRFDKRLGFTFGSTFFTPVVTGTESVTMDKWNTETARPTFLQKRIQPASSFFDANPIPDIPPIGYGSQQSIPITFTKHYQYQSLFYTNLASPESITVDKWFRATEQPIQPVKRPQHQTLFYTHLVVTPEGPITVDKWFRATEQPQLRPSPRFHLQTSFFDAHLCPRERTVYGDKYSTRSSTYSSKYSSRGSTYGDKYSTRSSTYTDKYIAPC